MTIIINNDINVSFLLDSVHELHSSCTWTWWRGFFFETNMVLNGLSSLTDVLTCCPFTCCSVRLAAKELGNFTALGPVASK